MTWAQYELEIASDGRGTRDITPDLERCVSRSDVSVGLAHVFIQHTSASLIVCENADPAVREDLERFMARAAPDGDPIFRHVSEGPDDMPAHVRSVLTQTELTLPVRAGHLGLGTWQGIYLWEHRHHPQVRRVTVTVQGR